MLRRMQGTLRMAHLVVGAIAVVAFLITGMLMSGHDPPVVAMGWGERLLFSSRHIYLMCGGLVFVTTVPLFFELFRGVSIYAAVGLRRTRGAA
jgi:hypothetical protein